MSRWSSACSRARSPKHSTPGARAALTEAGEAAFARLRDTAIAFDAKLRAGLADADLATLSTLLSRLAANARAGEAAPPWAGLADRRPE